MNTFFTKENLLFVNRVFIDYMEENYGVALDKYEDPDITRKVMFSFMSDINDETKGKPTKTEEKNIMLLTKTKQHYIKKLQLSDKKPNIQALSRDKDVFGNRSVVMSEKRPEIDPYSKRTEVNDTMERVMLDRYKVARDEEVGAVKKIPDSRIVASVEKDQPEPTESFNKRIRELEQERMAPPMATMDVLDQSQNRMLVEKERNEANAIQNHDPKAMFTMQSQLPAFKPIMTDDFLNNRQEILIPRINNHKTISKYLSINSFDRNWTVDPYRYQYVVNFQNKDNDIMNKYRNIEAISVSKVIIPEEVIPANSIINKEKTAFNHEFSFSYPYLLLSVDEFTDVYDGTNQHARKAFATLVYHRNYRAPNGRGFIILKPIQEEKKTFYPNLLSALPKLSLSLTKPDGSLLNTSSDNYKIFKVEYESFNPQYLKIVTDVYFDKNEFYVGDMIKLSNFALVMTQDARDFSNYINQDGGHEIKQLGSPNDNGYYKTFYIDAPGYFDKVAGRYAVAVTQIDALNAYNNSINWNTQTLSNGNIMNNSLQNTICMQLDVVVDDARVINQQIL
jgi:hypothetical protein